MFATTVNSNVRILYIADLNATVKCQPQKLPKGQCAANELSDDDVVPRCSSYYWPEMMLSSGMNWYDYCRAGGGQMSTVFDPLGTSKCFCPQESVDRLEGV